MNILSYTIKNCDDVNICKERTQDEKLYDSPLKAPGNYNFNYEKMY